LTMLSAPPTILFLNYFELMYKEGAHYIWAYTQKNEFLTIASGATPIGSTGRAPDDVYSWAGARKVKKEFVYDITPIRSEIFINHGCITQIFYALDQSNKAATYDSWVASSRQNSNAVICHKGKTPGSILCGLVYAHGCALLVCIHVYDAEKILVDVLGTLRTTGIHSL
jgi:hypothetical protein